MKFAATVRFAESVNVHVSSALLAQASPSQRPNVLPNRGSAVSVTEVPGANAIEQLAPSTMPPPEITHCAPSGDDVTTPLPVPAPMIVNATVPAFRSNRAVTERACVI